MESFFEKSKGVLIESRFPFRAGPTLFTGEPPERKQILLSLLCCLSKVRVQLRVAGNKLDSWRTGVRVTLKR